MDSLRRSIDDLQSEVKDIKDEIKNKNNPLIKRLDSVEQYIIGLTSALENN